MRKNYFAKKFVAYSMAFAVAFSTLTVSPVFVKEAKAAGAITINDGVDSAGPTEGKFYQPASPDTYNGTIIVGPVYSKISTSGVDMTLEDFKALAGFTEEKIAGSITNTNVISIQDGTVANAKVNKLDVAFNGKDRVTEDTTYGNINVKYEAKDNTGAKVTGCKWYKLTPRTKIVDYSENGTTEKITVPYYVLYATANTVVSDQDVLTFPEVNLDQVGVYVGIKGNKVADTLVLKEVSDMNAKASQETVTSVLGKKVTLGIDATATRSISYSWIRNGKELGTDSTLVVDLATKSDFGTYNCTVSDGLKTETIPVSVVETKDNTVNGTIKGNATGITTYKNVLDTVNNKKLYVVGTTPSSETDPTKFTSSASDVSGYNKVYTSDASDPVSKTNFTTSDTGNKQVYVYTEKGTGKLTLATQTLTLPSNELALTTSIPENNDFVYIWDVNTTSLMSNATKVNYDATNRSTSINKELFGSTLNANYDVTVKAVSKSQYEKVLEDELKAVKDAASYDKVTKVNALLLAEQSAISRSDLTVLFTETIKLQSAARKDVSEVKVAKIGDSLSLTTPAFVGINNKTSYSWNSANIANIATRNKNVLKINALGINDFCTYTCTVDLDSTNGSTADEVYYKVNVVYVSDFAASATEVVSAKVGAKNVTFEVNATSTLPITYTWKYKGAPGTDPNSGASPATAKNTYVIPEITSALASADKVFAGFKVDGTLDQTKPFYTCEVSDGIASKTFYFAVKQSVGFTVEGAAKEELAARENTDVTLAPVVKLDESKEVTYSWTKKGSTTVLSTDPTYTFTYDGKSVENYVVTITDGVQKETKEYEVSKFTTVDTNLANYTAFVDESVVYNGKEQTGNLVVKYIDKTTTPPTSAKPSFTLVNGKDYTVEYAENVNVGVARYTVKFIGDFVNVVGTTGDLAGKKTLTGTFFIDRADNELKVADKVVAVGGSVQPKTTNKAGAAVTYTYYTDEACTTAIEGVPTKVGVYYVKATSIATTNYNEATSNVAKVVIAPGKPKIGNTSRTASSVTLNWAKTTGATAYRVYVKKNGKFTKVANTTGLKYTVKGLSSATTYEFAVKAFVNGVASPVYSVRKTTTAPAKVATPAVKAGSKKATVTFKKVTRATGYQVYMAKGNGKYVKVATTKNLSVTKTGLTKGATYKFKVRAYKTVGSNTYYGAFSSAKAVKVK